MLMSDYRTGSFLIVHLFQPQSSSEVFCACEHRFEKNVPAGRIECNRWSCTDLDEKYLQKFDVSDFVSFSGAHRSRRLMSHVHPRY